jgi:hypothetical protein
MTKVTRHRLTSAAKMAFVLLMVAAGPAQALTKEYAVKFVCGTGDGKVLARGSYNTAINIMNPSGVDVTYQKRFAVALPGEVSGGTTPFVPGATLAAGDAVEIDCPDILEEARGCDSEFCKGFVTLRSDNELEVVAVYSAADPESNGVRSIHMDRVTTAGRCPVSTQRVARRTVLFVPPHVRGDRDFKGHGPCVSFDLDLRVKDSGTSLVASYRMHAFECDGDFADPQHDHTAAEGTAETVLFAGGPQSKILGYDLASSLSHSYIDTDHAEDPFSFGAGLPVSQLRYIGDTKGDEAGDRTRVFIDLRDLVLTLEDCADTKPEG